jgi:hypothetical protein
MLTDASLVVSKVVEVFESLGIAYLVGGSIASSIHGQPRSTRDADLVAELKAEHVKPLVAALEAEFYLDDQAIHRAIATRRSFNLIHFDSLFKADVFVLAADDWSQEQLRRRIPERLEPEVEAPVVYISSAEDIILQKLRWYQKGGGVSEQQWKDVQGVLRVQAGKLDYNYLRQWAAKLGLTELLAQALSDSGIENPNNDSIEKERKTHDE